MEKTNETKTHGFGGLKLSTTQPLHVGSPRLRLLLLLLYGHSTVHASYPLSTTRTAHSSPGSPVGSGFLREGGMVLLLCATHGRSPSSLLSESDPPSEAEEAEAAAGAPRCLTRDSGTLVSLSPSSYNKFTRPPCNVWWDAERQ